MSILFFFYRIAKLKFQSTKLITNIPTINRGLSDPGNLIGVIL